MHRGRSDTAVNANANSDAPRKFASEFSAPNLKQEAANYALRRNSLANANGFANEIAEISFSLQKFLANGRLRQNSLAIANAMAWCTQIRAYHFRVPEQNTPFLNRASGSKTDIANRRFETIRANRSNVVKILSTLANESIRAITPIRVANRRAI